MRSLTFRLLVLVCVFASAGVVASTATQQHADDAVADGGQWGNKGGKGLC